MAAAQMTAAQITTPQAPQQAAANDDAPDDEDNGTVTGAAKPGTRTAPQAPSSAAASDPANPAPSSSATPQSAAAAAQAAIQGAGKNANSNNTSANAAGDNTSGPDKPAKTADNNAAPQVQPQQAQQQPQPPQAPATSTAASAIPANTMPVQAGGTHNVAAAVQVQAQSAAQPTPDVNSLAVSIAARSQGGAKEFTIRLDPPELGRVDVRLSIDATGKTEAHLTADQPETLNLLQKDSGTLTQALRNSGLDVSQSGLNFSLRGQNSQAGNDNGGQARSPRSSLAATQVLDAAQSASSITYTGGGDQTRLDIHV
jgi:flagellar hook-length control protein FliK